MRKNCTHELSERETACADGACPICLKEELVKAQAENARLADDNRAWRTQEAHLLSKVGEVQEKMDRALSRKGILDLRNQLEATKRELLDAQGKALILKAENARLASLLHEYDEVVDELSHHWATHRNEYDRFGLAQQKITRLRAAREGAK